MNVIEGIINSIEAIKKRVSRLETIDISRWVYLTTPLTSTDWTWDSFSTTAKTLIDLSVVFAVPAGVKAVLVSGTVNDSGSALDTTVQLILSPNDTHDSGMVASPRGLTNDFRHDFAFTVPCNVDGDIYYQIDAHGASTFDVYLIIWGYMV